MKPQQYHTIVGYLVLIIAVLAKNTFLAVALGVTGTAHLVYSIILAIKEN